VLKQPKKIMELAVNVSNDLNRRLELEKCGLVGKQW